MMHRANMIPTPARGESLGRPEIEVMGIVRRSEQKVLRQEQMDVQNKACELTQWPGEVEFLRRKKRHPDLMMPRPSPAVHGLQGHAVLCSCRSPFLVEGK